MTDASNHVVRERLAQLLREKAGGYLHNVSYIPHVTCIVCAAPIKEDFLNCYTCHIHSTSNVNLASHVASLTYAVKKPGSQAYKMMRGYKSDRPGPDHQPVMKMLLALGIFGHINCLESRAGRRADRWAIVPSTKRQKIEHPLRSLV